ncbi:MAG: ATP-binding cassette domain-containing protein [Kofleriaceae bacterium]|nr:ATP-binding cassette domain-containing protein [Kofleriaceae bacterium]
MASLAIRVQVKRAGHDHGASFELDVALEVPPGITCVLGASGAGKSTLLGAVAGLTRPDAGRIVLGDQTWFDAGKRIDVPVDRRRVAYVFQRLALFPHLNAIHNVTYGMSRTTPRAERHDQAIALLERMNVGHLARRKPRTFSGGEAQRVALARALAMHPRVILLDEPFSALDHELRVQLAGLVRGLVDELGVPMLHVTHSQGEARALADRVVRIERGRITAEGTPAEVLDRPGEKVARDAARRAGAGAGDGPGDGGGPSDGSGGGGGGGGGARGKGRAAELDIEGTPMPEILRRR